MTDQPLNAGHKTLSRRTMLKTAAWSAPVIAVAIAAPAAAASFPAPPSGFVFGSIPQNGVGAGGSNLRPDYFWAATSDPESTPTLATDVHWWGAKGSANEGHQQNFYLSNVSKATKVTLFWDFPSNVDPALQTVGSRPDLLTWQVTQGNVTGSTFAWVPGATLGSGRWTLELEMETQQYSYYVGVRAVAAASNPFTWNSWDSGS